jgi:hypothetical protein
MFQSGLQYRPDGRKRESDDKFADVRVVPEKLPTWAEKEVMRDIILRGIKDRGIKDQGWIYGFHGCRCDHPAVG